MLITSTPAKNPHDLPSLVHPKGRWQVLSVGLVFSRVPLQDFYVWATLHLQSSIKSSWFVKLSLVPQSPFIFVALVFILEPHFCSHPGQNLSSFPNPFWINFLLMTRSSSLNTTRRSHLQPNHPIPRPYHTGQTPFLCIFKINLPHLQVKNYQEILKKPQTLMNPPILSLSTSPYPMEWRVF